MPLKQGSSNHGLAWAVMLFIGISWGAVIPLTKVSVSTGHQPFGLLFWQLIIGIVVLGAIQLIRGWRPVFNKRHLGFFLVVALTGTLIPNSVSYLANQHLPAGVMAIVIATVPMFTLVLALAVRIEAPSMLRFTGLLTGFFAMLLILAPDSSLPDPDKAVYLVIALVAPLCYGIESVFVSKQQPDDVNAITILFMAYLIGLVIAVPLVLASGQWIDPLEPWGKAEYALIVSSLMHVFIYCTFLWLIGYAGPVFSDQVAYPVTISALMLSMVFLGENYSGWIWAALVLVILGLAMVQPHIKTGDEAA